jgi:hypothetical protein
MGNFEVRPPRHLRFLYIRSAISSRMRSVHMQRRRPQPSSVDYQHGGRGSNVAVVLVYL